VWQGASVSAQWPNSKLPYHCLRGHRAREPYGPATSRLSVPGLRTRVNPSSSRALSDLRAVVVASRRGFIACQSSSAFVSG